MPRKSALAQSANTKTATEIAYIEAAMAVTVGAFKMIENILQASRVSDKFLIYKDAVLTSEWLRAEIESYFLSHSYICPVKPDGLIIGCGVKTAAPHFAGVGPIEANQPIVVDLFPQHTDNHYFADMTRTYVKGESSLEIQAMYEAVAASQLATLAAVKSGVAARDLYDISAEVLLEAGFAVGETGYVHSLGHGVGVDIHEAPHLSPKSEEVLVAGQVITIEPGLYYEGVGGVRLEDTIVVTETGYQNLTNHPIDGWIIS